MVKAFISPLFFALLCLLLACLRVRPRFSYEQPRRRGGFAWVLLLLATIGLWALSTPVLMSRLAQVLESPFEAPSTDQLRRVTVMTVLSGGLMRGPDAGRTQLGESTFYRTERGAKTFLRSDARLLVLQGTLGGDHPAQMVELMKGLAVSLGVPADKIVLEPHSHITFEHPSELLKIDGVSSTDVVGVVTSAWHLRRAVTEFRRVFALVIPIPADYFSYQLEGDLTDWIPQSYTLARSTTLMHEIIGIVWYQLWRRLQDPDG